MREHGGSNILQPEQGFSLCFLKYHSPLSLEPLKQQHNSAPSHCANTFSIYRMRKHMAEIKYVFHYTFSSYCCINITGAIHTLKVCIY